MRKLLLLGGGHAHLFVLKKLAEQHNNGLQVTLVSPSRWQIYSGMLPGWMAGHYQLEDCRVDLLALAEAAGARFLESAATGLDAGARKVQLADGSSLDYDLLSMDVGSETRAPILTAAGTRLITIKPLADFIEAWPPLLKQIHARSDYHLLIAGGGAAGVELALSARYALRNAAKGVRVTLVSGSSGLLNGHAAGVKKRVSRILAEAQVSVVTQNISSGQGSGGEVGINSEPGAVGEQGIFVEQDISGEQKSVLLEDGTLLPTDCVIAATGASAPTWLSGSGLRLNDAGFVLVDACHRSIAHPEVFAAGDICARTDVEISRSGVHAVRVGPVLADNLLAASKGEQLKAYRPQRRVLYLLACGERHAVASWDGLSAEGAWVWRWKDRIDRTFISRFTVQRGGGE